MIVFDLDGTLALDEHRVHHLKKEEKDWQAYFDACDEDVPNHPILSLIPLLHGGGHNVAIWSGRSVSVFNKTYEWLKKHDILECLFEIRVRDFDDRTHDDELKKQWLGEHNASHPDDPVTLVFEDRKRVVDMWRAQGIVCCQVAPGDF